MTRLRADGIAVDVLINNAGFGLYGKFTDIAWEREQQMLDVDIATVVRMTRLFVPDMAARKSGWVLQVASVGAFLPSPLYASYSAAKAFVLSFSEAINFELRGTGVSVTTTCPGMIRTEFHDVSGQAYTWFQRLMLMESEPCVRASINAMLRRKASVVPGRVNALMIWSLRLTPRWLMTAIAHRTMQPD